MYSKFYGFSHKPFELAPNPDLVFLSETHQEALAVLLYGVYNRKGFLQITGKVGTGKSTLVQALIQKLENNVHLCHIPNPNFTVAEFYFYIGTKFGLDEFDGNKAKFILNLAEFLKQCREKGEFALLIIDEAQVLSLELLEEIRLLSNQEYTDFGVLSVFFVGQPELDSLLKHKKMEPLRNRIGLHFNLEPLTFDETVAYIQFRLKKAGRTAGLFSPKALEKIHEASGGIPRTINILCDNSLLAGYAEQRGVIDESIITGCIREIEPSDKDSAPAKSSEIKHTEKPVPVTPKPVPPKASKNVSRQKIKTNSLLKKLAYVFVFLCALFIAMIFTTEYWGRLPGAEPARAWFEKLPGNERLVNKMKEMLHGQKSREQLSVPKNNKLSEKAAASSLQHKEKENVFSQSTGETDSIAEPMQEIAVSNKISAETIEKKQNPDGKQYENSVGQTDTGPADNTSLEIAANAAQIEIKRNPDGTSYINITRQFETGPGENNFAEIEGTTGPAAPGSTLEGIGYASITDQVGGANIRSGPSMDDEIIRAVIPGYPFLVIGQHGEWALVEDFKQRKGWIAGRLIAENNTVIVMAGGANLHNGPGYQNDIVADMDYGTVLKVEEKKDPWLKVYKKDGIKGWISKDAVWP